MALFLLRPSHWMISKRQVWDRSDRDPSNPGHGSLRRKWQWDQYRMKLQERSES